MTYSTTYLWESSVGKEFEFDVEINYIPGEAATYWDPGCDDDLEIISVSLNGKELNIADWFHKQIKEDMYDNLEDYLPEQDYPEKDDYHYYDARYDAPYERNGQF